MWGPTVSDDRQRSGYHPERPSVDRILRGLLIVRSLAKHDNAKLRWTIETAATRLRSQGLPEAEFQRLRNYALTLRAA